MATAITLRYDLDLGTLNQRAGTQEDSYISGTISFDPITLTLADDKVTITVDFTEVENGAEQNLELRTLGQNFPYPVIFATREGAPNGHDFGPGIVVRGRDMSGFEGMNVHLELTDVTGPLAADRDMDTGEISGHDGREAFEFRFIGDTHGSTADLLDDLVQPLRFDGFSIALDFQGGEASVTIDQLSFRILASEINILRAAPTPPPVIPPEPPAEEAGYYHCEPDYAAPDFDWNALARHYTENYERTGQWWVDPHYFCEDHEEEAIAINWNAVAEDYTTNWENTGHWYVTPGKFPEEWGVG